MLVVRPLIRAAVALSLAAPLAFAQKTPKPKDSAKIAKDSMKLAKATKDSGSMGRFFRSEEPVVFTLTTNIKRIKGDKDDNPPWRAAKISYAATAPDTGTITIPVRIKTRGIWRRKNCEFPPIWLNFDNTAKKTIFGGLDQVKLANYCRNNDESESYILRELQVNRALRLLTPYAHS